MMETDVLVIGSGPGGSSVAYQCAEAGRKVTVVDTLFGGTCALRGCTPKKAMEAVTSVYWEAKAMEEAGFPKLIAPIHWHDLMAHQSKFTSLVPAKTKEKFTNKGITPIVGHASFIDAHTVQVGADKIRAQHIVIATGAYPRKLDIPGFEYLLTNDDFFALDELPEKVVVVGGGYIGFEMAHIMAACGTKVSILSSEDMPLSAFDSDLVAGLVQATLAKGITVKLGYEAHNIEYNNDSYQVTAKRKDGKTFNYEGDLIIHAAGRVPAINELGIDKLNLKTNNKNGIAVNKFLQPSNHDHIYALGDVTGQLPFTEIASYEADIVSHNILNDRRRSANYEGVPFGVFTHPKLAMVGASEKLLEEKGIKYQLLSDSFDHSFMQRTKLNTHARYKTLVNESTGVILGASILACSADEMINLFSMAIQKSMTNRELKEILMLYPTSGQEVKSLV